MNTIKTRGVTVYINDCEIKDVMNITLSDHIIRLSTMMKPDFARATDHLSLTIVLPPTRRKWARSYRQESVSIPVCAVDGGCEDLCFIITGMIVRSVAMLSRREVENPF